jgi:HAMP domain-containing protein
VLGTTSKLADTAQVHLAAISDDMARRIRGQMDTSVQILLRDNLKIAHASTNEIVDDVTARVSAVLNTQLRGTMRYAADSVSYYAVLAMTRAIRDSLQPVIHGMVGDARTQLDQTLKSTDTTVATSKTLRVILWSTGIAVALGLAGGCVFLWLALRRRQGSLSAVVDAIDAVGSDTLKHEVAARAAANRVDPWLDQYVRSRRVARGVVAPIVSHGYSGMTK